MANGETRPGSLSGTSAIMWFREDLRLADNPALAAAVGSGSRLVCVYVLDEESPGIRPRGGASRWWLHGSLAALARSLEARGASLHLRRGSAAEVLPAIVGETSAKAVFWNRRYGAAEQDADVKVAEALSAAAVDVAVFGAKLLHEPAEVRTKGGGAFRVFTPFWSAAQLIPPPSPLTAPDRIAGANAPGGDQLESWNLLPRRPDWAGGFREIWRPGEDGAAERVAHFLEGGFSRYAEERDFPGLESTSRLSPHLAFGEIGPRQIWATTDRLGRQAPVESLRKLRSELGWREFAWHLLFHNPDFATKNFSSAFDSFRWAEPGPTLKAWQQGRTGYPIVDAAMRQLWRTGWMHNRLRMVAGSFLVKHLLIDWRLGEAWFWDTLVDADPANNAVGWQWIAGSGADPAPYFRIFNPVLQGQKFDAEGNFIRRFVPELAGLPAPHIHAPWKAPAAVLSTAGVRLGESYPHPIVEHGMARARALAAFAAMRAG